MPLPSSRSDRIRTCGLCVPNAALYQTEPHFVIQFICSTQGILYYRAVELSTTFYIFLTKYFIVTKYKGQGEGSNHYKPFNLPKSHAKSTFFHFYNKKRAKISSFRPLIHTHKPFFSLFYHVSTHFFPFYFVFHQVYTLPLFPFPLYPFPLYPVSQTDYAFLLFSCLYLYLTSQCKNSRF